MKFVLSAVLTFIALKQVNASSWFKGTMGADSRTEAGTCTDCDRRAFQGRSPSAIDVNYVGGKGSMKEARAQFSYFVKNNPECLPKGNEKKYGIIANLSNGTGNNLNYIVEITSTGKTIIKDFFWAGEGQGVSNDCGSNASPRGFMKIGNSDYRPDTMMEDRNGNMVPSSWPQCGARNPGFKHNRIFFHGLEKGFNDNLSEQNVLDNPNNPILFKDSNGNACNPPGSPRMARLHSISYSSGNTTKGCKGLPIESWCKWAPKLIGGCAYNYDGNPTPATRGMRL